MNSDIHKTCLGCVFLSEIKKYACVKFNYINVGKAIEETFPIDNCFKAFGDKNLITQQRNSRDCAEGEECEGCICLNCDHDCCGCSDIDENIFTVVKRCDIFCEIKRARRLNQTNKERDRIERSEQKARAFNEGGGRSVWSSPTMGLPSLGKKR